MAVGSEAVVGDFSVTSFKTPHDAVESVGYKIQTPDGKAMCVCTDLGHVTEEIDANLSGCELVLLESNYDERMLRTGPYPYPLKQRIASGDGHLSNVASSGEVKKLISGGDYADNFRASQPREQHSANREKHSYARFR